MLGRNVLLGIEGGGYRSLRGNFVVVRIVGDISDEALSDEALVLREVKVFGPGK